MLLLKISSQKISIFDKIVLLDINTMLVYECCADVGYDALGSITKVIGIHNGLPIKLVPGTKNCSAKQTAWTKRSYDNQQIECITRGDNMDNSNDLLKKFGIYDILGILGTGIYVLSTLMIELYFCAGDQFEHFFTRLMCLIGKTSVVGIAIIVQCFMLGCLLQSVSGFIFHGLQAIRVRLDKRKGISASKEESAETKDKQPDMQPKDETERLEFLPNSIEAKNYIWYLLVCGRRTIYRNCSLSKQEQEMLTEKVKKQLLKNKVDQKESEATGEKIDCEYIYQYYKNSFHFGDNSRANKDQAHAVLARNISVAFVLLALIMLYMSITGVCHHALLVAFVNLALAAVFWLRCERFIRLRYLQLVRLIVYQKQEK